MRNTFMAIAFAISLIFLFTYFLFSRVADTGPSATAVPLPVLATSYTVEQSFERESSFLGLVKAGRSTKLGFEMAGVLTQLQVKEGSKVAAGDIIAIMDDTKLQSLSEATSADLNRVKIELQRATIKAGRQKNLSDTGAVSREAFDDTRLIAQALRAQVDAVQAQLDGIKIDIQKSTLRAPYPGVIANRYLDRGAVVSPGTAVVKLIEAGVREAHIGITVEQIASLKLGKPYTVQLRGQPVEAILLSVRPDVDPVTRTTTAVFSLPVNIAALDGEPISLDLPRTIYMEGAWLPLSALLDGQRGLWTVLRIEGKKGSRKTVREAIEVLEIQGDMAFVRGSIADGSLLVSHGVHRLVPGTSITVVEDENRPNMQVKN